MKRSTAVAGILGTLAAGALVRGAEAADTIRIANASGSMNQTMATLMAKQRFLEKFGLDPQMLEVSDGSKILGGIVGGSVDASYMSGFNQIFPAIAHGADLKVIGGGALTPILALFTGKLGVKTMKDLEGRTVGSGSVGALTYQLTVTLLKKHGVDVSKIHFVNIGSSADVYRAVAEGTVDAGACAASLTATAVTDGVRLLPGGDMTTELSDYTYQGAWSSSAIIAAHRDILVKGLASYASLFRFVQSPGSKNAYVEARQETFPKASAADNLDEWLYIQKNKPFAVNLALTPARINYMQQLNVSFGVQDKVLPYDKVADMSLAHDALALLKKA